MVDILHTPLGHEHPYMQQPEERFPREPLAGEPFTIGIITRPQGAARSVTVHTRIDGAPGPSVAATFVSGWEYRDEGLGADTLASITMAEQDLWRAPLTAPERGRTLTYWIEADGQRGPQFTLRGEAWQLEPGGIALEASESGRSVMQLRRDVTVAPPEVTPLPRVESVEWLTDGQRARRVRVTFACAADEAFFGFGERFNALNQRGEILDIRCYEQYKNQGKRAYLPIPFMLSSAGYGLYVESSRWMQFDLAATHSSRWVLEADLGPDERLTLRWLTGDSPLDIIAQFARLTGPASLPPEWAFGLWISSNEWNSQERVMREVQQSLAHGIAPAVVVIEAWSDETTFYIWNDAQYDPLPGHAAPRYEDFTFPPDGKWPNPREMIGWLHAHNIRVVLWQIPVLKAIDGAHPQHDADREYFEQQGFGVREADGNLYTVRPLWFRGSYLWDVTNPAAREWWLQKRAYLLEDLEIDGFKTDGGEHLWGSDTRFYDGRRGDELVNVYPQLYTEAYYQFASEQRRGDALTFSRAGFVGSQRSPAHWAGDENSTWDAFRHSILAGLSAGISGIPFWTWDLGGFSGELPPAELYLRSAAMAVFSPLMQYHSEFNHHREPCHDRTPWNIQRQTGDERIVPIFRALVQLRHRLMPYIWREAQHAARTGEPMMRALALWDRQASPYHYFFGRDLLVCPVVEPGAESWPVALPQGDWIDFWTGERLTGPRTIEVAAPLDRIPVFVRAGAALPLALAAGAEGNSLA